MHTIYLDILFCVNFIIDYMLLLLVKTFLSLSCRLRRLLAGAAVGGLSSFVILLPPMPSGFSLIISLAAACAVVGSAFSPMPKKMFFKAAAAFFLVSFVYCGIMMAVWMLFSPENILIRNTSVYIGISPISLVITAVFCYVIMLVIIRITGRGRPSSSLCSMKCIIDSKEVSLSGKVDTGNSLKEPFSGLPVIVIKRSCCPSLQETEIQGCRLIPFTSVGGNGMLTGIKVKDISIKYDGAVYHADAYIAPCDNKLITGPEDAVVPYELVS